MIAAQFRKGAPTPSFPQERKHDNASDPIGKAPPGGHPIQTVNMFCTRTPIGTQPDSSRTSAT